MANSKIIRKTFRIKETGREIIVPGRQAWTLERLIDAGSRGLTTIDHPAPRTSAYVHFLKKDFGINIDMVRESHKGAFPGVHGRYFLKTEIQLVEDERGTPA
ncbi:MAG TPA: hypothetical protein VGN93_06205 [Shinella sp.]|jgi:hypothetical protein|uniref:winged helix domain-containing protein n=1 Tax=Shinella sp. TaxID=1870904 RepID=UPI002E168404|nr:hypothetical protein [Shinella sp.]